MAGVDRKRGDTLTLSVVDFAERPDEPSAEPLGRPSPGPIEIAKWAGLAAATLLFLLAVRRGLKRRERQLTAIEPTWVRDIERATPVAELGSQGEAQLARGRPDRGRAIQQRLDEVVREQPDQVAIQVGQWMSS